MSEPNQPLSPQLTEWLSIRDQHIEHLQHELDTARAALLKVQSGIRDGKSVQQNYTEQAQASQQKIALLEQNVGQWQQDYEQLRRQKGGFGFKAILAAGTMAFVVGIGFAWLFFRQKDPNAVLFGQFSKNAGFNLEYNITHHQYADALKIVSDYQNNKIYAPIAPELSLIGNLIKAARLGGDTTQTDIGYAVIQEDSVSTVRPKPVRSLTIIHESAVPLLAEAAPDAQVLFTLRKKDKVDQWDRTPELSKIRTTNTKGKKGQAEDYWYEVETKEGTKGWVFGYYTNASANRFKPDELDSLAAPAAKRDSTIRRQ